VAGVLIEAGASLLIEDFKGRTPIDLISGPVKQALADASNAGCSRVQSSQVELEKMVNYRVNILEACAGGTEVFSWGNGANYQLGTGTVGVQKVPCRLDSLQGLNVTAIAAAKFHSMAITADGKLYSWGFGRGGRLGHSDFDIHRCDNNANLIFLYEIIRCKKSTKHY
jgi:alpha-tubulin suppressor-like RCC1 family protein